MLKFIRTVVTLALIVTALCAIRPAAAADMTWTMRSSYDYKVSLAFYSQDSNRVWPGNGDVYVLADSRAHPFTLACHRGEKICYGAWPTGGNSRIHWGVGRHNEHTCRGCCFICGESNPSRDLTE